MAQLARSQDAWRIAPVLAMAGVSVTGAIAPLRRCPGPRSAWPGMGRKHPVDRIAALGGERVGAADLGPCRRHQSYSQLDRASQQLIDVTEGLESTLVMLGYKLRDGVTVVRDYGGDLPRIEARPRKLDQVWTNLSDNAIDATGGQGTLRVSVRAEPQFVIIEVADTGPDASRGRRPGPLIPSTRPRTSGKAPAWVSISARRIIGGITERSRSIPSRGDRASRAPPRRYITEPRTRVVVR